MTHKVVENITARAVKAKRTVVLPESADPRVLQAAEKITANGYAHVILLGKADAIFADAKSSGVSLGGVEIVDHTTGGDREKFIEQLYQKRKAKGITKAQADEMLASPVYYGGFMVGNGSAHGMVAGSICPTADTCRAALFGAGLIEGNKTLSSCSIMLTIIEDVGVDGALIFADTGVLPEPTVEQLADIGILAAGACKSLLDVTPAVAMLSFSTKGSAHSPAVQKVIDATNIIKRKCPDLHVDGELQLDAAVIGSIGKKKCPDSPVAGKANTLVFPDLSCGNIGYKLVERLGKAVALGPLLMGAAKPINDLSRGCSVDDIVLISAITAVQSL